MHISFLCSVTSGQVNFRPGPMLITFLPITFESRVIDEQHWYQDVYLVAPNRMLPNMSKFDLA